MGFWDVSCGSLQLLYVRAALGNEIVRLDPAFVYHARFFKVDREVRAYEAGKWGKNERKGNERK
jgi:hypothetical protein